MARRIDDPNGNHPYQQHQLLFTAAKNYQNPNNYYAADPVNNHSFPWQQQQHQLLLPYLSPNQLATAADLPAYTAAAAGGLDSVNLQLIMNNNNNINQSHLHDLESAFALMNLATAAAAAQPPWPSQLAFPPAVGSLSDTRFQSLNSLMRGGRRTDITDLFPPPNSSPATAGNCPDFSRNQNPYGFRFDDVTLTNDSYDLRHHHHRNHSSYDRMLKNDKPQLLPSNHRPPRQRYGSLLETGYKDRQTTPPPSSYYSPEEVRERLVELAKAKESSRTLQAIWESHHHRNSDQLGELIFAGVKANLNELMEDQYGNHLVQKIFELCSYDQMAQILLVVGAHRDRFVDTCLHQHGTRAVQKMIQHIQAADQRASFLSTVENAIIRMCKDQHGQHVVQQCLKCFVGDRSIKYVLEQIAEHCLDLSMDKSGCCVVQAAVSYAKIYGEAELLDHLCARIVSNALILSEHPFGNYVVQYVIELRMEAVNGRIVNRLIGNHVGLSMSKYGSNVVEKCLRICGDKEKAVIINEIMNSPQFLDFLQDPYGNYVAQTALKRSEGVLQNKLVNMIQEQYPYLHSHLHGKKVLARTSRSSGNNNKHLQQQHRAGPSVMMMMNEFPRRHF